MHEIGLLDGTTEEGYCMLAKSRFPLHEFYKAAEQQGSIGKEALPRTLSGVL